MLRFVLDEDVQLSLAAILRDAGHEAVHIQDLGLKGAGDEEVFAEAQSRGSVLVTGDIGLADLRLLSRTDHHGVVLLRMPAELPTDAMNREIMRLLLIVPEREFAGSIVVVEPGNLRVRRMTDA